MSKLVRRKEKKNKNNRSSGRVHLQPQTFNELLLAVNNMVINSLAMG